MLVRNGILCIALCAVIPDVVASSEQTSTQTSDFQRSEIKLSAKALKLTKPEFTRYTRLMRGPLRFWNSEIDPLLALGMFEDDPTQRFELAKRYAQQEHELITRLQRFDEDYRLAFNQLFPDASIIDENKLKGYYATQAIKDSTKPNVLGVGMLRTGDRLMYFPDVSCTAICQGQVDRLIRWVSLNNQTALDIYVRNTQSAAEVRRWAKELSIPVDQVKAGYITLNINQSQFQSLNKNSSGQPSSQIFLSRDKNFYRLDPSQVVF